MTSDTALATNFLAMFAARKTCQHRLISTKPNDYLTVLEVLPAEAELLVQSKRLHDSRQPVVPVRVAISMIEFC